MGVKESYFDRVIQNIKDMVEIKRETIYLLQLVCKWFLCQNMQIKLYH